MPCVGKARVGHPAPPFVCESVLADNFKEISLDYYLAKKQWLILMFIPAAFSFVCPTEVLAFHNCNEEFTERGCAVAFVSTDSKYSLWQWQHLPKNKGGIGHVSVPLLSDQSHRMSRDYGVLVEKDGLDLRGMFIIDPKGIIQQITMNNIPVGRSVLEALRLVEAFKAVAEKGVLCPAGW
ncbi:peroxiredoxin TSA1, partial [Tothia fuscella]